MSSKKVISALVLAASLLAAHTVAARQGVLNSPHNLSASGGLGAHKVAYDEIRVCVFCHTPHNAQAIDISVPAPLWNRALPAYGQHYTMYQSDTFRQNVNPQPTMPMGSSRVCLSCHDGTLALNAYGGKVLRNGSVSGSSPVKMPTDLNPSLNSNLGTDLSDDHPISFNYNGAVANANANASGSHLVPAAALPGGVKLESSSGNLECIACHDPHDNEYGNFLVMNNGDPTKPDYTNTPSPLCIACHIQPGWDSSGHNTGAGCLNCHITHTSPVREYLLGAPVSDICFSANCHGNNTVSSGTPVHQVKASSLLAGSTFGGGHGQDAEPVKRPASDLQSVFRQAFYKHPVGTSTASYKVKQQLPLKEARVECVDCHSAHVAGSTTVMVGGIKKSLKMVKGVSKDTLGAVEATSEYQICYKCHSGNAAYKFLEISKPNRMIPEFDQMRRFDSANPSFHPVGAIRRGSGASLLAQYQNSMLTIECSDCHNSDQSKKAGGTGPNGPHGSRYEHILLARYDMPLKGGAGRSSFCSGYQADYALCFTCHNETYVVISGSYFANNGVNEHAKHTVERCIPCFACHDPHGVPFMDGATAVNNAHLINFDRGYTVSQAVPRPVYTSLTAGNGTCTVSCHNTNDVGLPPHTHRYVR